MQLKINKTVLEIKKGDITDEKVDAIVNSANPRLSPGGGVSGAIHKVAGEELWKECKKLGGCAKGEAKITSGYKLPAKYVIHTVGPVYGGDKKPAELLEKCYRSSMKTALKNGVKSIAFPAISTGIYGYPMQEAAEIAINAITDFISKNEGIEVVKIVLYDEKAYEIHKNILEDLIKKNEKIEKLKDMIKKMKRVLVAFSGGVDSTFLTKICSDVLGKENVVAVTAQSELYTPEEIEEAKKMANFMGVEHLIIHTDEMKNERFISNDTGRCYICKKELFMKLREIANSRKIKYILDGSNADDIHDFRPGRKAVKEFKVISPLMDVGLTKEEIRFFSKKMNLPYHEKPSNACLASRFPYGEKITKEKIKMVYEAEKFLRNLGFRIIRVRHHGKIARIEVNENEIKKILEFREKILREFKRIGYVWICLDIERYRTGSMNEELS